MRPFLFIDLEGLKLTQNERELLQHPAIAGVILFTRNYQTPTQLHSLCYAIKSLNPALYISVDQEGGRVQRFKEPFSRFHPVYRLGELYEQDPELALSTAKAFGALLALELQSVGIDFSFAPVLDRANLRSRVIGDRAISQDVKVIVEIADSFIEGVQGEGMPVVGKHFPGHGGVDADSHLELPIDSRPFEQILHNDLQPFKQLSSKLDAIMPAHVVYTTVDATPACFSHVWLDMLRQEFKFSGVVISDDLSMQGAKVMGSEVERSQKALDAGVDYLLMCNNRDAVMQLIEAVDNDELSVHERRGTFAANRPAPKAYVPFENNRHWQLLRQAAKAMIDQGKP